MKWRTQPRQPDPRAESRRIELEAEADLERCGALKDFWYVACLSSELKEKQVLESLQESGQAPWELWTPRREPDPAVAPLASA